MRRGIAAAVLVVAALLAVGAGAPIVAAQDDATPGVNGTNTTAQTPTPTPTPTPDGSEAGDGRNADLRVTQPGYVDSPVDTDSENGTIVYQASGEELLLTLENDRAGTITNYGVEEAEASMVKRGDTYVFTPDASGTYSVWWTDDSGSTYRAYVQIDTAGYVHLPKEEHEAQQAKADAWGEFVTMLDRAGIVDGDESIEHLLTVADEAVQWYQFYLSPFSALTGGFIAILTILISEPGGWLFLALLLLVFGLSTFTIVRRNRKLERQFRDIEDLDEADRRAWEQEIKRNASKSTLQDWGLTDAGAEAVKQHTGARNPRQFASWIAGNIGEFRVIRALLGAYEQLGHEIEVRRSPDGELLDAELVQPDASREGDDEAVAADGGDIQAETIPPSEAGDDVLKRLEWTELEGDVLWHPEVDASALDLPVQNDRHSDGVDLIEDADIPIGEDGADHYILKRREEFVDVLIEIVEEAAASTYTDEDGRPRPEVDFVEMIYSFCSVGAEKYRLPFWHLRDILLATRAQLDDDERLDQLAQKSEDNEL